MRTFTGRSASTAASAPGTAGMRLSLAAGDATPVDSEVRSTAGVVHWPRWYTCWPCLRAALRRRR